MRQATVCERCLTCASIGCRGWQILPSGPRLAKTALLPTGAFARAYEANLYLGTEFLTGWLGVSKTGRCSGEISTLMLRGTPGWRRIEALAFESENHLVDGRRGDAEAVLDVGFGGRPQVHARVGVDEGEILPLGGREAGFVSARHLIHLSNSTAPPKRRRR